MNEYKNVKYPKWREYKKARRHTKMSEKPTVKVLAGRRVTLPPECCNELNIREGDLLIMEWDPKTQKITLTLAVVKPRSEENHNANP